MDSSFGKMRSTEMDSVMAKIVKYLRLKRYQYEVTFSLYVLTPMEKFVLDTFVLLCLGLIALYASRAAFSILGALHCMLMEYVFVNRSPALNAVVDQFTAVTTSRMAS